MPAPYTPCTPVTRAAGQYMDGDRDAPAGCPSVCVCWGKGGGGLPAPCTPVAPPPPPKPPRPPLPGREGVVCVEERG